MAPVRFVGLLDAEPTAVGEGARAGTGPFLQEGRCASCLTALSSCHSPSCVWSWGVSTCDTSETLCEIFWGCPLGQGDKGSPRVSVLVRLGPLSAQRLDEGSGDTVDGGPGGWGTHAHSLWDTLCPPHGAYEQCCPWVSSCWHASQTRIPPTPWALGSVHPGPGSVSRPPLGANRGLGACMLGGACTLLTPPSVAWGQWPPLALGAG